MTIELEMLNDEYICIGDLKRFLSTIPDNYVLSNNHMNVKSLKIKTDREFGNCEINLIVMKQITKQKIEKYEKAFNEGLPVYMFIRAGQDLRYYSWVRITDKKQIKKCVLNDIQMRIDN